MKTPRVLFDPRPGLNIDENAVVIVGAETEIRIGRTSKPNVAAAIFDGVMRS